MENRQSASAPISTLIPGGLASVFFGFGAALTLGAAFPFVFRRLAADE